jgi:LacI family transcriptional regulator
MLADRRQPIAALDGEKRIVVRRPDLRQVADRAGVGIASASRVLSGQPGSSRELRERVLQAAGDLGYAPNMLARGLRRRASMSVGFVASDVANPLVAGVLRGAEAVLGAAGYSMLLTDSGGDPRVDAARLELLRQRQVDGVLILPVAEDDAATLGALRATEMPLVVVDRTLPEDIGASYVLSDHQPGVRAATEHLLGLGHRRLGLVTGRDVRPARERALAIRAMLPDDGVLLVESGTLTEAYGRSALASLLGRSDPPTAVVLGGNQLLVGALRHVRGQGLVLGRDLDLVTCDDIPLGQLYDPPVPAVARDIAALGRAAAELLLERMVGGAPPRSVMLPTWFLSGSN